VSDTFDITFLCTGNRLRSPVAEALARDATQGLPVTIRSLGLLDLGAVAALPEAVAFGRTRGVDLTAHRASQLVRARLGGVDLVLGFERSNVMRAVVDGGAQRDRTFLLAELVDLLAKGPAPRADGTVESARRAVRAANDRRDSAMPASRFEIRDPLGLAPAQQEQILESVAELTSLLVRQLFGR
jgi:protein-tyrosine-phosphatase